MTKPAGVSEWAQYKFDIGNQYHESFAVLAILRQIPQLQQLDYSKINLARMGLSRSMIQGSTYCLYNGFLKQGSQRVTI